MVIGGDFRELLRELLAEAGASVHDAYVMALAVDGKEKAREDASPHGPDTKKYVCF